VLDPFVEVAISKTIDFSVLFYIFCSQLANSKATGGATPNFSLTNQFLQSITN